MPTIVKYRGQPYRERTITRDTLTVPQNQHDQDAADMRPLRPAPPANPSNKRPAYGKPVPPRGAPKPKQWTGPKLAPSSTPSTIAEQRDRSTGERPPDHVARGHDLKDYAFNNAKSLEERIAKLVAIGDRAGVDKLIKEIAVHLNKAEDLTTAVGRCADKVSGVELEREVAEWRAKLRATRD